MKEVLDCRSSDDTPSCVESSKLFRVFLGNHYPGVYLSRREAECVLRLLQGKKRQQIAIEMEISARTLDGYIKSIKTKLGCHHTREIVLCIHKTDFAKNV